MNPHQRGVAPLDSPRRVFDPFETHAGMALLSGLRAGVTPRNGRAATRDR